MLWRTQVVKIKALSPSVKHFTLRLVKCVSQQGEPMPATAAAASFRAGQWVDLQAPNVEQVGGYSVCSAPSLLREHGLLELAVKRSLHPPSLWLHDHCHEGCEVSLNPGGRFYFDPPSIVRSDGLVSLPNLLLVAGGVGINPLLSILTHVNDLCANFEQQLWPRVQLLHAARTLPELLFRDRLERICNAGADAAPFSTRCFVSRESAGASLPEGTTAGRINAAALRTALDQLEAGDVLGSDVKRRRVLCYLCGPPPMIQDVERMLLKWIPAEDILYENWWDPAQP